MIPEQADDINQRTPKISVIIPVKNREKVIGNCLKAVLTQSLKPFEVIVVDGHSTDRTVKEVKKFPVKLVYEDYGTVGGARQVGLENSKGEYVAFTDSDCIPQKDWLKNLMKEFNHDFIGVGGGIKNVGNEIWSKTIAFIFNTFVGSANSIQGRLFKTKRTVKSISGSNSMYRRTNLMEIGGFNTSLSINEDTELNLRLSNYGKLFYVPNAIVLHNPNRKLRDFAQRIYDFGSGRGRLRLWDLQCIPPIILLLLILSIAFNIWIFTISVSIYALIIIASGTKYAIKENNLKYIITIPIVYMIEHSLYTLGFWKGILQSYFLGISTSKNPRK
jgi:glycosyltransferase involved in cell wall biosynthesis